MVKRARELGFGWWNREEKKQSQKEGEEKVGGFEKHTRGIGMKLLKKMGYNGGGLGLNEQGIRAPIELKVRPKNMGMGFNVDDDHDHHVPRHHRPFESEREEEELWSVENTKTKKTKTKKRIAYMITAEQVLAQAKEQEKQDGFKIIDMRGPHVRVITNLENLNSTAQDEDDDDDDHEMADDLIADIHQKLDWNLRKEREAVVALRDEKEKLEKEAHEHEQQIWKMEEIMSVLGHMAESFSLESIAEAALDLQARFPDEYETCNVSCIACSHALPLFIRLFEGWNPLESPTHGTEAVSLWKRVLKNSPSMYTELLMEVVFPAVQGVSGLHPEPVLVFLDSWQQLLPPCVVQVMLDTVVMPKIAAAVESCDDKSALRMLLSPWRSVFDSATWEHIMVGCIVPKLWDVMNGLEINPGNQQNIDQFEWVQTWVGDVPAHHLVAVMDVFFDKWQRVLHHWLCSRPDFEQVRRWYLGWKGLIHRDLLANEHVRFRLCLGLQMIDRAVQGLPETTTSEEEGGDETIRLKDVIEVYAQENDLVFKPKPGRTTQDGHQIYGFGDLSIVIDSPNQRLFALTEDRKWSLVSLDHLLQLQRRRPNQHSS